MNPSLSDKDKIITLIQNYFNEKHIEKVARITGFVKRRSKLQGAIFFYLCVFSAKRENVVSMEDLSSVLALENISIKKQSLQDRFNIEASRFVKQLVSAALSKKLKFKKAALGCSFSRIIISDSTSFQLPATYENHYKGYGGGASKSGIKNQYSYDLLSGELIEIAVRNGTVNDFSFPSKDLRSNDLRIEDLGYFKTDRFKDIISNGAYFLSRLKFQHTIYQLQKGEYKRINLLKTIRRMRVGEIKSMQIYLGEKEKLPLRLILERVREKLANEKRRKLLSDKVNKRKRISKERLMFCNTNAFITNCTEMQLPNDLVRECYSLRWQIEIIFKAWKSYFNIDKVRQMKVERFECYHYGCLMLIIISTHLLRYFKQQYLIKNDQEISELKFFKLITSLKKEIKETIKKGKRALSALIDQLKIIVEANCCKEQRINKLQPLTILKKIP
jgi:hypothetical protein